MGKDLEVGKTDFFQRERKPSSLFFKSRHVFTLTTRNEVLTKRTDLHFTSSLGTFSLSRVSYHSLNSPTATLYQKKPTRVLESSFFMSMGSSFYSHTLFVVQSSSFVAKLRQVRKGCVFSRYVCSRGFCGSAGGAEGRER